MFTWRTHTRKYPAKKRPTKICLSIERRGAVCKTVNCTEPSPPVWILLDIHKSEIYYRDNRPKKAQDSCVMCKLNHHKQMTHACSSWLLGWLIFTDCRSILKSVTVLILWMLFFWLFFLAWFHAWQLLPLHYRATRSTRPCGWSTEWISCEVSKSKVEAWGNVGKLIYVYFTFTFFFDKHLMPNFRISSLVQEFSTNRLLGGIASPKLLKNMV